MMSGFIWSLSLNKLDTFLLCVSFIALQMTDGQFIALGCLFLLIIINLINELKNDLTINKSNLFFLFLWIFIILSLVKFNQIITLEGYIQLFWLCSGLIILSGITFIKNKKTKKIMDLLVMSTTFMGILVILGYYMNFSISHIIAPPYVGTRVVGGFDGPNEIAAFNLIPLTYSLNMLLFYNYEKKYLINILITSSIIIISWSRGGLISLGLAFSISFSIYIFKRLSFKKFIKTIIVLSLIFLLVFQFVIPELNVVRRNASSRISMISMQLDPILEKPILGWGVGSFSENSSLGNATPHNGYIYILYAGGIIAFVLYLIFHLRVIFKILNSRNYIFMMIYLTFLIQEMVFNNLVRGRLSLIYWIIVLLIFTGERLGFNKVSDRSKPVAYRISRDLRGTGHGHRDK